MGVEKTSFGKNDYLVTSFDKPAKLLDPVKPWLFDVFFVPNNKASFAGTEVEKLWGDWNQPDCLRGYLKSADTHGKEFNSVTVPFFGIDHPYPGKPKPTQEFSILCVEHENLVILRLMEQWINLIMNFDPALGKTMSNNSMYSVAETIWDLAATVKIMNRGIKGKYLKRHTEYVSAWPLKIDKAKMADMKVDNPPDKNITFKCLLGNSQASP